MSHPLPTIGQPFVNLASAGSTNEEARVMIREGTARSGMVIFTTEQHAGRGQRGRIWKGERDASIAWTSLLQPQFLTLSQQISLSQVVALSVHDLLSTCVGPEELRIKLPNDIYWRDRKIAGILIESVISASGDWQWAIVGIGINVNQEKFPEDLPNPVSLLQISGRRFSCEELALQLCTHFNQRLEQFQLKGATAIQVDFDKLLYTKADATH